MSEQNQYNPAADLIRQVEADIADREWESHDGLGYSPVEIHAETPGGTSKKQKSRKRTIPYRPRYTDGNVPAHEREARERSAEMLTTEQQELSTAKGAIVAEQLKLHGHFKLSDEQLTVAALARIQRMNRTESSDH